MNTLLMMFGAITIIGAVLMALVQHDLKRLLAFHAVSQVGYMLMGIGTGTALGLAAGLFHMLNHAIYKSCSVPGCGGGREEDGNGRSRSAGRTCNAVAIDVRRLFDRLAFHFRDSTAEWICFQVDGLPSGDRIRPQQRRHAVGRMADGRRGRFRAHAGQLCQSAAQRLSV